jgi:hypothetical protein
MANDKWKAVLVDCEEDLFALRGWEGEMLGAAGIDWVLGPALHARRDAGICERRRRSQARPVCRLSTRPVIEHLERCRC